MRITQAVGLHMDLLTIVKSRKFIWYGHVTRSSSLAKTVLQCIVEVGGKQGRPRKRWACNIKEWTGFSFANSQKAAENREKCQNLVVMSSLNPPAATWSRDRWGWRWYYFWSWFNETGKQLLFCWLHQKTLTLARIWTFTNQFGSKLVWW